MYCWAHSEPIIQQLDTLPGKLSLESWPPLQALLEGDKEDGGSGEGRKTPGESGGIFICLDEIRLKMIYVFGNLYCLEK